jgi:hypothetical protein
VSSPVFSSSPRDSLTRPAGAVEISYPAPEAPEYARRLVAATPEANVLCAAPNAPTVHVTADNTLKVMVGYNDETGRRAVVCPLPPPQLQPQPAPGPSSATAPPVVGVSPTVQWLITEAAKDARYASFKAGRHHVLTNPGVVSSWQFAVEFSKKHSGMPSPVAQLTVGVLRRHLVLTRHLTTISPPPPAGWRPRPQASSQDKKNLRSSKHSALARAGCRMHTVP